MKRYLLRFACGLAGIGAVLAGPAHAVIAGGMVGNGYYYPKTTVKNADGLYGYSGFTAAIRVTRGPGANGNTFYSNQFFMTGGASGYAGIQANSNTTKTVIFSIWGSTYDPSVDQPGSAPGAVCRPFGGEGTGTHCLFTTTGNSDPAWRAGRKYTIYVRYAGKVTIPAGHPDAGVNYLWRASIINMRTGASTRIGTIHTPASNGLLKGMVPQFVENFTQGSQQYSSCAQVPPTTAVFYAPVMYDAANKVAQASSASTHVYGNCASIASSMMNADRTVIATINQPFDVPFLAKNDAQGFCADTMSGNHMGLNRCVDGSSPASAVANQSLARDAANRLTLVGHGTCLQGNGSGAVLVASCTADKSQEWLYMPGTMAWFNVATGQCLNATGDAGQNSTVNLADCVMSGNQEWVSGQP